jgi:predicted tellurium resistance membrane protein TerC
MELLLDPQAWLAFVTLTALEIVLGIDNIIFISILVGRLPKAQQARARFIGLTLAMVMRILLLLSIAWIMKLTAPWFAVLGNEISGRDLILIGGGAFLLAKSTTEIHASLEGEEAHGRGTVPVSFAALLVQIAIIDIVFSLDSVITAVGLAEQVEVMIAAIVVAVGVMMVAAAPINAFVDRHPTVKMLALSFLILVGVALIADGFGLHIPKGYIYFAMAFSLGVEMLNLRLRRRVRPVKLHHPGPRKR